MKNLKIISVSLLDYYKVKQPISLLKHYNKLKKEASNTLQFYTTTSAIYSSIIEGSRLELEDYLKIKDSGMNKNNKDFKQVNDLIKAYEFAQKNKLNYSNLLKSHSISAKELISQDKYRGKLRDRDVAVFDGYGNKVFQGCKVNLLQTEMDKLFSDIEILVSKKLSYQESFYYASMIHLVFVKIHPFADGNGRTARLLEKWFLASVIDENAWKIMNEKLYHKRIKSYYASLRIGVNYESSNYELAYSFLKMLPMALRIK